MFSFRNLLVARDILLMCLYAGIFEIAGLQILSYLDLHELTYILILCRNEIQYSHIGATILTKIVFKNSKSLLGKLAESFDDYYLLKLHPTNAIYDKSSGITNVVENNYLLTFHIREICKLSPSELLENIRTATDISNEQKLSTKWKFDEAEVWETTGPAQIEFNPVFPIYAIVNTTVFASLHFEFVVYALPSKWRKDRGQILFRRSNKEFKQSKGKTILVWSSDGFHLCVVDHLESRKTRLTFYRFFHIKGVFKQIKDAIIESGAEIDAGWNPWFDSNTVLVPMFSLHAPTSQTVLQGIRFLNSCTFELFKIKPRFDNIPFKGGFFSPCNNGKHCFIVAPCKVSEHKHDTLYFYNFEQAPVEVANLHIPGIVHAYTNVPSENKVILMVRGNRHYPKRFTPSKFPTDCALIQDEPREESAIPHEQVSDNCYKFSKLFLNFMFIEVDLMTMDAQEMISKLSLPSNIYGFRCDDSVQRFTNASLANVLNVSKHFVTVATGQRNFYINRHIVNNMASRTGRVKFLHPTLPIIAIRTGLFGYLDKQVYSFYLLSSATSDFRKQFPKNCITAYSNETIYKRKPKIREINALSELAPSK